MSNNMDIWTRWQDAFLKMPVAREVWRLAYVGCRDVGAGAGAGAGGTEGGLKTTNPANENIGGVRIGASLMAKDYSAFFSKLLTWL
ncbi:hypothetical protein TMES_04825 [Thalassospira mesophila]|uniref:Uncharacterized protein n=1 Tax=Thalassospira mesophila TaxID=1293891 RepID=A0A1Y2L4C0_9PROT|nr:hypothetical protein TMES_04825 [Thalassospira mesophila]